MSDVKTEQAGWGWWEWNAVAAAGAGEKLQYHHLKYLEKIGLLDGPITYETVTEKLSYGTATRSIPHYTLKPEVQTIWQERLSGFNNCGTACRNVEGKFMPDGRCRTCGAGFSADGTPKKTCKGCGKNDTPLLGHIMGVPEFCSECNDKQRAASGTCGMCRKPRWDCCC